MNEYYRINELSHHGIKGQKWGIRRFQNKDGTLTDEGRERYNDDENANGSDTAINSETPNNKSRKGFIIGGAIAVTAAAAAGTAWYLTRKNKEKELATTKEIYKNAIVKSHEHGKQIGFKEVQKYQKELADTKDLYKNAIVKSHEQGKKIGFNEAAQKYKNAIVKSHEHGRKVGFNAGFDVGAREYRSIIYSTLEKTPSGKTGFGKNWLNKIRNTVLKW